MKCLITGISGFVGSHLTEYLIQQGIQVYGTVYPSAPQQNIQHLKNQITIIPCDLTIKQQLEKAVQITQPDRIFHLAGQSHPPSSWKDPLATFQINVFATIYLIETIKNQKPDTRVLIVGSGDEYGNTAVNQQILETTPLNPQTPYAVTKTTTDLLAGQLAKYHNLCLIRVRPFPHIGPRQHPNFVVADFSRQIALIEKKKHPPVIKVGNLETKRDFSDVRDIVRAYWLALERGTPGDVYNISSNRIYSINELLQKLLSLTKTRITIEQDPAKLRLTDIDIKHSSSQKFRKQTGWQPEIPIEKTLADTLNWWRENIK